MRCDPFWLFFGRDPLCIGDDACIVPLCKAAGRRPPCTPICSSIIISDAPVGRNFAKKFKIGAQKQAGTPLTGLV